MTESCSAASSPLPSLHFAFEVAVDYSGPWNATLTAYSGAAAIFTQCYVGSGPGYMVLNDWNPNGSALLKVIAHKMDGGSGNLTLSVEGGTVGVNSTVAPLGSVSASTSLPAPPTSVIDSPGDLVLELSIGASILGQPNAVQLNMTEYNIATSNDNVTPSSDWPVSGLSLGPCGTLELPFGIAVYQGHYTSQNITSAIPLTMFTPNANGTAQPYRADCPANPQVFSYDFAPESDTAVTKLTWAGDASATTYQLSASFSVTGYWNSASSFTAFGKGAYTVLAGDEWGHSSVQYFTIPDYQG